MGYAHLECCQSTYALHFLSSLAVFYLVPKNEKSKSVRVCFLRSSGPPLVTVRRDHFALLRVIANLYQLVYSVITSLDVSALSSFLIESRQAYQWSKTNYFRSSFLSISLTRPNWVTACFWKAYEMDVLLGGLRKLILWLYRSLVWSWMRDKQFIIYSRTIPNEPECFVF